MLIYKIHNTINDKVYVGKTISFKQRVNKHKQHLNKGIHNNKYLQNSWNKHTSDKFEFSIIEECSQDNVDEREIFWIAKLKANNSKYGYNLTFGGEGGIHNESTRKILSEKQNKNKKKVYGFSKDGKFIKDWDSIKDCAKSLICNPCDVRRTIRREQITCKGIILQDNNIFIERTRIILPKGNDGKFMKRI